MENYTRMTKTTNIDGRECISCVLYGTDKCTGNCAVCPVWGAILKQLWAFEEVFAEDLNSKE